MLVGTGATIHEAFALVIVCFGVVKLVATAQPTQLPYIIPPLKLLLELFIILFWV